MYRRVPAWLKQNAFDIAAFIWGVAEATLFFFVPDVLLSYIGLKRGVKPAVRASLIAAAGASLGGVMMYLWSTSDPATAREAVLAVPSISEAMAARASGDGRQLVPRNFSWAPQLHAVQTVRHPRTCCRRAAPRICPGRHRRTPTALPDRRDRRLAHRPDPRPLAQRTAAHLGPHRRIALILRGIFHPNAELTQP